ncbi:MAG: T9SS type A sorting domain-containing protein [Ignavibacteria bacterium]
MKNIFLTIVALLLVATVSYGQVKVNFNIQNPRFDNGQFLVDIYGTVPAGQTWNVGLTNIRFNYWTSGVPNEFSFVPESPATGSYVNLSGNANYDNMTSTKICNDTAASLNILLLYTKTPYALTSGSYWLGSLRFNVSNPTACFRMSFMSNSSVFDGSTPLTYSTGWSYSNNDTCLNMPSGISSLPVEIPKEFNLSQNYPNPFNPVTMIKFALPKASYVTLRVYDMLGREVANLVNGQKSAGQYIVDFDASSLTSGIYFYRLETNGFVDVKRMVVLK